LTTLDNLYLLNKGREEGIAETVLKP
jgi:hypothetical protein